MKIGIRPISDHNGGDNKGMAPHIENWHHGKRQPAGKAYGLREVEVFTSITVKRIVLQDSSGSSKKATGVELASGQILKVNKEVIVCCGALRTPQLLMLSGIGPADELQKHSIPLLVEAPDVGKNLFDHGALTQFYRIHNPEKGLCAPSPSFNNPSHLEGFPTDYIITESVPDSVIKSALQLDFPRNSVTDNHPHLFPPRSHYEILQCTHPPRCPSRI